MSALDTQISGDHYKSCPIQPVEYTFHNNLNFLQGNIVKYVTRYKDKNGKDDLLKVIHYAELLIELEYPEDHVDMLDPTTGRSERVYRGVPNPRRG